MAIVRYIGIALCLLLPSCAKQQLSQQKNNIDEAFAHEQKKMLDDIIQQEAMLIDVPIPLYDDRIIVPNYSISESNTLAFGYKSILTCAQAHDFFMNQMERYGWQHLVSFNAGNTLLQFSSPRRYCTVIIKSDDHDQSRSHIFIYIKKVNGQE